MNIADIPTKFPQPWGAQAGAGYIRPIPNDSQIGSNPGYASLHDGFVPLNATPTGAGGIPPFIQDMNGILNEITAWDQWWQAGGPVFWDSTFATEVGGYPKGAIVHSNADANKLWINQVDGNATDPDSGGANWANLFAPVFLNAVFGGTTFTFSNTVAATVQGSINLGANATATTQGAADNDTSVATTAFVHSVLAYDAQHQDIDGVRHQWFYAVTVTGAGDAINWPLPFGGVPWGYSIAEDNPAGGWGPTATDPTIYALDNRTALGASLWGTRWTGTWGAVGGLGCRIHVWGPKP